MFGPEERQRAVGLCSATPMATAQVVEHLGYPTRRCLERCLAKGPRYAGRMRIPIIPLETGQKAIEPVLGGMRQRQAARRLGVETPPAMTVTWRRCAAVSRSWNRGKLVDAGGGGGSRKKTGRRSAASVEQGEDAAGRPSAAGVFTRLDGMLARHRTELFCFNFSGATRLHGLVAEQAHQDEVRHEHHGPAQDIGSCGMIGGDGINDEANKTSPAPF